MIYNGRVNDMCFKTTFFITGATGLIGSTLVKYLIDCCELENADYKVIALVRSTDKAKKVFGDYYNSKHMTIVQGNVEELHNIEGDVDYIIHGANPTSSKYFVENPVETLHTAICGTENLLKLAVNKKVKGFIFLSTMETYGIPQKGEKITEDDSGRFNTMVARNCYPLSKQICENMCFAYYSEYGVPTKIARLTQTFGPGVSYNDGRVFAEFARCAIEHRNIILKTKGETERSYLYTEDAVSAILTILLHGENGQAYSVANEDTYCSIYEMAVLIANKYGIKVEVHEQDVATQGYASTLYMDLDTSKLQGLGWKPEVGLEAMYSRMIDSMKIK